MFQELLKENLKPGMRALDVGSGNQKSISFHFFEFGLLGLSFFFGFGCVINVSVYLL